MELHNINPGENQSDMINMLKTDMRSKRRRKYISKNQFCWQWSGDGPVEPHQN